MALKNLPLLGLLPLVATLGQAASLTLVNDNFNNSNFATVGGGDVGSGHLLFTNGSKTASETTVARWLPGTTAANWQRAELHSNDEIAVSTLLNTYDAVQFSWTLSSVNTVRRDAGTGAEYRIQLGVLPQTVTQGEAAEMWVNTQGGIWFDMNVNGNNSAAATTTLRDANIGKSANSEGVVRGVANQPVSWDWANTSRTFTLTMDADSYEWTDSAGNNYGGSTYANSGFSPALLTSNMWGFVMGQDRDGIGRGGHDLTNFSVVAVPEPASMLLVGMSAAGVFLRRRRLR